MDNLRFGLARTVVNSALKLAFNIVFNTVKNYLLPMVLLLGSMISIPAYAWPDVDHMNMCGASAKVVRSYGGNFKSWTDHDNYIAKRGKAYYYRTMCPQVIAVKNYKSSAKNLAKKSVKRTIKKRVVRKPAKRIAKSTKARSFKRKVKYNKKADCIRVDRMNASGAAVRVVRRR